MAMKRCSSEVSIHAEAASTSARRLSRQPELIDREIDMLSELGKCAWTVVSTQPKKLSARGRQVAKYDESIGREPLSTRSRLPMVNQRVSDLLRNDQANRQRLVDTKNALAFAILALRVEACGIRSR